MSDQYFEYGRRLRNKYKGKQQSQKSKRQQTLEQNIQNYVTLIMRNIADFAREVETYYDEKSGPNAKEVANYLKYYLIHLGIKADRISIHTERAKRLDNAKGNTVGTEIIRPDNTVNKITIELVGKQRGKIPLVIIYSYVENRAR